MTVYVDDMRAPFGRYVMCHCWADTRDELFAMMTQIGVQLKWFQRPDSVDIPGMSASWEHFDIAWSKRALAIKAGAVETDKYGPIIHTHTLKFIDPNATETEKFRALHMMTLAAGMRLEK